MNSDFDILLEELLEQHLVVFTSTSLQQLDILSHTLQSILPHRYYKVDGFRELGAVLSDSYVSNDSTYIIDMVSRKDAMIKLNYKPAHQTNFIFIPTYHSMGYQDIRYTIPNQLLYKGDSVYFIEKNKLECLKSRTSDPNRIIKYFPEVILRKQKIERLIKCIKSQS